LEIANFSEEQQGNWRLGHWTGLFSHSLRYLLVHSFHLKLTLISLIMALTLRFQSLDYVLTFSIIGSGTSIFSHWLRQLI